MLEHPKHPCGYATECRGRRPGKFVLASLFAADLLQPIKVKVAGTEGDFDTLLAQARVEEARLRDLRNTQRGWHKSFLGKKPPV